jgi:hypothetical protein
LLDHLAFEWVASLLPVENAASIAAYMLVSVMNQVLVGQDARDTSRAGTVDDNLIVLGERGQSFLGREKVKRAGDMLCTVLSCTQGHHELKMVLALQFPLQFIVTDEFHVIFHGSISYYEGSRMSTSPHLASALAGPTNPALLRESGSICR